MAIFRYPQEIIDYVKANTETYNDKELADRLNKLYEYEFTEGKVRALRKNHKIKCGRKNGNKKGVPLKYPVGLEDFVKREAAGRTTQELTDLINKEFGEGTITPENTRTYKKNHRISSGVDTRFKKGEPSKRKGAKIVPTEAMKRTQFKKGNIPPNIRQIGDISRTTDGYLIIKIKSDGIQRERWQPLHRYIWEKENGNIPPGKMLTFLDGNKENCNIENIALIDKTVNALLNTGKMRSEDADITKAGINIARLKQATRERRKKANG